MMKTEENPPTKSELGPVLFLNLPIDSSSKDVIGLNAYAESISKAIDEGAQTIAVTSSFGMGKTSVVELLREKRADRKNEQILKVPMWTQLKDNKEANSAIDLHRNFIYQIASQIDHRSGTYVSRRLSTNYRLLKIHTNKPFLWIFITLAIAFSVFAWGANTFENQIIQLFPKLTDRMTSLSAASIILAVVFGIIAIVGSEIIVSRGKGDSNRQIEMDEIIDIYYSEILKNRNLPKCLLKRPCKRSNHYIVVVEDLDRSNNSDAVKTFLKEFRKYYLSASANVVYKFKNNITFIINIKPESEVNQLCKDTETTIIYDKIFDYILNIQPINIDDYTTILDGLLQGKKTEIAALGLNTDGLLSNLPGMQWIIREPKVGMREIKERLNRSFALYRSLQERFPLGNVAFEKCAVVAYITTAFEAEFKATDDSAFQKVVEWCLKERSGKVENAEEYKLFLPKRNSQYVSVVLELVRTGIIDTNYRMYFYNYPKNSRIYSVEESVAQKAILYGSESDNLNHSVQIVEENGSSIVSDSLNRLKQLGLPLPEVVFHTEELYKATLKRDVEGVIQWLDNRDYSTEATEKTISQIEAILHFDSTRSIYNESIVVAFCKKWEQKMTEEQLLRLRLMLCEKFPEEILWYKQLYRGVHVLANRKELDFVAFEDTIELIDQSNKEFSEKDLEYLLSRYESSPDRESCRSKLTSYLQNAASLIDNSILAPLYLRFMLVDGIINDFLEEIVFDEIRDDIATRKEKSGLLLDYQNLIVKAAQTGLSLRTMENIQSLEVFSDYSVKVAQELRNQGYIFESVMILLALGEDFDMSREEIVQSILEKKEWLLDHPADFSLLRQRVVQTSKKVLHKYKDLFADDCPIMNKDEFAQVIKGIPYDDLFVISLIPSKLVTQNEIKMLCGFFNREWHNNSVSFSILQYIAEFSNDVSCESFKSLDFEKIQYKRFSGDKQDTIKKLYESSLSLNTTKGKIQFMTITKRLDWIWENQIQADLQQDSDLCKQYVNAVSLAYDRSITQTTAKILGSLNTIYAMPPKVTSVLFKWKQYECYIVSKTLFDHRFTLELKEKGDFLWAEYMKVFKENKYKNTIKSMCKNTEFLQMMMDRKEYQDMDEEARINLASIYQDAASLLDVMEYGDDFALRYYLQMAGFKDEEAATTFVNILEGSQHLLSSQELYDHAHDKLISGVLKGRYTRLRNKIQYN